MEATAELTALGYIGVRSTRLDDWAAFATRLLGMQQVDRAGAVRAFRMDDRKQRLIVTGDENEGLGATLASNAHPDGLWASAYHIKSQCATVALFGCR